MYFVSELLLKSFTIALTSGSCFPVISIYTFFSTIDPDSLSFSAVFFNCSKGVFPAVSVTSTPDAL